MKAGIYKTPRRTQDEIVERIEKLRHTDPFGFGIMDLVCALDYEHAKPYLTPEAAAEEWIAEAIDRDSVIARMLDYMPFAWEKANDGRGLSAARSIAHYESWLWLIGEDLGDLSNYQFYGKDELRRICDHFGWDADRWDDGIRTNFG